MVRQLKHEEIQELLGAYALDALEADEGRLVDAHLPVCPRCRQEVRDHREVASLLAYSGAPAPPGLWDRLAAALDDPAPPVAAPALAPVTPLRRAWPERRTNRWRALVAAAAALVLVLGLGGGLWVRQAVRQQDDQIGRLARDNDLNRLALAMRNTPGARVFPLMAPKGETLAYTVLTPDGAAYLQNVALPPLREDRTYQLWAVVDGGQKRSVGVLGPAPTVRPFSVPTSQVAGLAITEEVATGAVAPTAQPLAYAAVVGP